MNKLFKLEFSLDEKLPEKDQEEVIDWFIQEVKARLKSGRNFICIIHGPTGSGKSYLAMKIAEVLDPTFNVNRVLFNPENFFKLVKTLPPDSFVVVDEAGAILDARRFMTAINCITSYVLETFRFKRVNVIFTVPSIKMLDINVRRLMHCMVFQEDRGKARIYKIMMSFDGATWPKRIGTFVGVSMPSQTLCDAYEEKKHREFDSVLEKAIGSFGVEETVEQHPNVPIVQTENVESVFSILES